MSGQQDIYQVIQTLEGVQTVVGSFPTVGEADAYQAQCAAQAEYRELEGLPPATYTVKQVS